MDALHAVHQARDHESAEFSNKTTIRLYTNGETRLRGRKEKRCRSQLLTKKDHRTLMQTRESRPRVNTCAGHVPGQPARAHIRRRPDPHTANPHRVVDPPWCPPAPLQNMPGTTAFARHSLVSIALRLVLPLCFFEGHCIVNCEARPPHSKVQPPQNRSTATFRNRENQNGPLGTAMILMGPTGVNIGQYRSISVNIGQYRSILADPCF